MAEFTMIRQGSQKLEEILVEMLRHDEPVKALLSRGLALALVPGKTFAISRRKVAPSEWEVKTLRLSGQKIGLDLSASPVADQQEDWCILRWTLAIWKF